MTLHTERIYERIMDDIYLEDELSRDGRQVFEIDGSNTVNVIFLVEY